MDKRTVEEIISLYSKHGWKLRRVLLSQALAKNLGADGAELFSGAKVLDSDIDAAWFSRSSKPGNDTWEIRRLSSDPFALCEVFSDEDDEETREEAMFEMESKLRG